MIISESVLFLLLLCSQTKCPTYSQTPNCNKLIDDHSPCGTAVLEPPFGKRVITGQLGHLIITDVKQDDKKPLCFLIDILIPVHFPNEYAFLAPRECQVLLIICVKPSPSRTLEFDHRCIRSHQMLNMLSEMQNM